MIAVQAIALVLMAGALAAAIAAVMARALFVTIMCLLVVGALAGAAMLALGAGDAALALIMLGVGIAPMFLLGAMLLTTRASKARRGDPHWLSLIAAIAVAAAVMWGVGDLGAAGPVAGASEGIALAAWIAPLVFVAAAACLGLLGFGERGALESRIERDR